MDKVYNHKNVETRIYKLWESKGCFTPKIIPGKKPFTIILPLPNANDPMHMGHALFTIQDILIRYHRMLGEPTLWLPGGDHAGIETQFVFEKKLAKEGKSRFDFDRNTLFGMISEFVEKNKDINRDQMKLLGFSLDFSRYHFSLEPKIVEKVLETFKKLYSDDLIYRAERLVNYCTKCGTAFSDLEIKYIESKDHLYYIKYGPFVLATTRPETKFGDTAVCFHPGDKRYEKYLGQELEIEGVNGSFKVKVVSDNEIDPEFGTGIEKVTPAHDMLDFEIAKRHKLPIKKVIELNGRLNDLAGRFSGMKVKAAREAVVLAMKEKGLIDHIDENYVHNIAVCYKCGTTIEPMLIPQWYIKTKPLAKPAIEAVKSGKTKIVPTKRFQKMYFDWMENILDWNISRQIVWGPRIPIWYCLDCNESISINFINKNKEKVSGIYKDLKNYKFEELEKGLQSLSAPLGASYSLEKRTCEKCGGNHVLQETDTFDTWFLSSQWPVNTLKGKEGDFEYFYPTSVLDTLWDILFFWVGRMMMMGLYLTKEVPFKVVHIHSRVVDKFGQKMSKSKGNVINPIEFLEKYGADALRMALIFGTAPANDISISEEKVRGMRNFCNKVWNASRFVLDSKQDDQIPTNPPSLKLRRTKDDKWIIEELDKTIKSVTYNIKSYHFGQAAEIIYEFFWHKFCDVYIEKTKERRDEAQPILIHVLSESLKLLHPFMPFITEEIWNLIPNEEIDKKSLIVSKWPIIN